MSVDIGSLRGGQTISMVWEDSDGTVRTGSVIVLSTHYGLLHFIDRGRPRMIDPIKIWSFNENGSIRRRHALR